MSKGRLAGKRAIITGGSRGIGLAIAETFVAEGARCAITSRSQEAALAAAEGIDSEAVLPVACDVTDDASVAAMAATLSDEFGGVDIIVNNAGGAASGPFAAHSATAFLDTFDLNVAGAVRVVQAFLPAMVDRGQGRIVNIASTAGLYASPGQSPYNTSKHAMVGLSKCLALELAQTGVTCNAICPGFVDTDLLAEVADVQGVSLDQFRTQLASMTPMKRILDPSEVAHLALYLASDEASGMTGQATVISNGMRMH